MQKLILEEKKRELSEEMLRLCKKRVFLSNLKKIQKFFKSEAWKRLHDSPEGYNVAKNLLDEIFGRGKFMIYDANKVIHDDANLLPTLTSEEREVLDRVDRKEFEGLVEVGDYIFLYIGSVFAVRNMAAAAKRQLSTENSNELETGYYTGLIVP